MREGWISPEELENDYREMGEDSHRERESEEWSDVLIGDPFATRPNFRANY
jgi:hypothetical protein